MPRWVHRVGLSSGWLFALAACSARSNPASEPTIPAPAATVDQGACLARDTHSLYAFSDCRLDAALRAQGTSDWKMDLRSVTACLAPACVGAKEAELGQPLPKHHDCVETKHWL